MKTIRYKWAYEGLGLLRDPSFLWWIRLSVTKKEVRLECGNDILSVSMKLLEKTSELIQAISQIDFPDLNNDFGPHAMDDGFHSELRIDKILLSNLEMNPDLEHSFLEIVTGYLGYDFFETAHEILQKCSSNRNERHSF